jgi:cytochrome P450
VFWSKAGEMVSRIQDSMSKTESNSVVDITAWVNRAALDIIGIAALGVDFASLADPNNELSRAYQAIFEPNATSTIIFLLSIMVSTAAVKLLPLKKAREIRAGSAYVKKHIRDMFSRKDVHQEPAVEKEKWDKKNILSVAEQYGGFTTDELVDQARTFLVAGHETTATGIQWALYTLTRPENLHVQKILRDEIHKDLPNLESREEMSAQILDKLPYLDAVSKEALRVNGPSPFSKRSAVRDTELHGIKIGKGTAFLIPNWAINKSKDLWGENARIFDPERWLSGKDRFNGGAETLAFQTFSSGTRGCIGKSKLRSIVAFHIN